MLAREGIFMNHKELLRLYREEGLKIRGRAGRKRAMGSRAPLPDRGRRRHLLALIAGDRSVIQLPG
jgi:putative transposase